MTAVLTILVVAAFLTLAGGVVYLWLRLNQTSRREGLQALAARRGWALNISGEYLGRPGMLRLSPRGGPAWTVETRALASLIESAAAGQQATEYVADEPRWPGGLLILLPPLPAPPAAGDAGRGFDGSEDRAWLAERLGKGFVRTAPGLFAWPAPAGIGLLCTQEPVPRFDPPALARALDLWATGHAARPVVVFGPEGLRLHLPEGLRRADQMERFVDLAHELARLLTGGV
ncbi:MAG: hypothetical protein H3C51_06515 [Rubellimicrobium sp.]|nr:hypothetical protein [Rubellimicrobium sp.]